MTRYFKAVAKDGTEHARSSGREYRFAAIIGSLSSWSTTFEGASRANRYGEVVPAIETTAADYRRILSNSRARRTR